MALAIFSLSDIPDDVERNQESRGNMSATSDKVVQMVNMTLLERPDITEAKSMQSVNTVGLSNFLKSTFTFLAKFLLFQLGFKYENIWILPREMAAHVVKKLTRSQLQIIGLKQM